MTSRLSEVVVDDRPETVAMSIQAPLDATASTECNNCKVLLVFPNSAHVIQCGSCKKFLNVESSTGSTTSKMGVQYCLCNTCKTLLSYPSDALEIQCPECNAVHKVDEDSGDEGGNSVNEDVQQDALAHRRAEERKRQAELEQAQLDRARAKEADEAAKKEQVKDPRQPKRSRNAFVIYTVENREEVGKQQLAQDPEFSFQQISSVMGKMWRALSEEEKQPYKDKAKIERRKYEEALEEYKASGGTGWVTKEEARLLKKRKKEELTS